MSGGIFFPFSANFIREFKKRGENGRKRKTRSRRQLSKQCSTSSLIKKIGFSTIKFVSFSQRRQLRKFVRIEIMAAI